MPDRKRKRVPKFLSKFTEIINHRRMRARLAKQAVFFFWCGIAALKIFCHANGNWSLTLSLP